MESTRTTSQVATTEVVAMAEVIEAAIRRAKIVYVDNDIEREGTIDHMKSTHDVAKREDVIALPFGLASLPLTKLTDLRMIGCLVFNS